jgi:hypothetical protein
MIGKVVSGFEPLLISSRMTVVHKRVFPAMWFGFLAVFAVVGLSTAGDAHGPGLFILIPVSFMATIGFILMKKLIFDLVDEVWDDGSALLIKNGGREVRVELAEIMNISNSAFTNPPRVTLSLRHSTSLGQEISFLPPTPFLPFVRSPVVDDLIRRVDAARMTARR